MRPPPAFLITCEHGGNRIPSEYRRCFSGYEHQFNSHRGYDPGALTMARDMARRLDAPLVSSTISRLLVDLNRSLTHPRLHGEPVRSLSAETRRRICKRYYLPYRTAAATIISAALTQGRSIVHLSSHSFTPVMNGVTRQADVGLLYDPRRSNEATLCASWIARLAERDPALLLRRNYPYRGTSDGFTAYLRRHFSTDDYMGIEVEINQSISLGGGSAWRRLRRELLTSFVEAIAATQRKRVSG